MLTAFTTGLRFRLAVSLAAFAALCFVAPPAVMAFGHGTNTAHCLTPADVVDHGSTEAQGMKHHGDHSAPAGDLDPTGAILDSPSPDWVISGY
jgi:hypothetical protein